MGFPRSFPFTGGGLFGYDGAANISIRTCFAMEAEKAFGRQAGSGSVHWEKKEGASMADKRMTQTQLVKKLAESAGVANKVAKAMLETYAAIAVAETKKNGVFVLPGVGRLVRVDRKARMGRNPATGQPIKIPAKKVVKFRVAKAVKDAIVPPKKK
jgi:DNA-binding protein HU-beta